MTKRGFDILVAIAGLAAVSPLFIVIAALIKLDSKGPVFFRQARVGRAFRSFVIYKFRTMACGRAIPGTLITAGQDSRITRVGRYLRAAKLDELPQLINVLKGDMSFVGPRPEVAQYVELFRQDYAEVLRVRPGITDLASLKYRDESALLGRSADPEADYVTRILPDKIRLAKLYVERSSLWFDLVLIVKTLIAVIDTRRVSVTGSL